MGESTDAVRENTPREIRAQRAMDDPRVPWWANWGMKAIMVLGIPGALLGWREFRDWKLEDRRIALEEKRVAADEKQNVLMERFERVLWKVEQHFKDDTPGK
jgi:hypothetical protein